MAPKTLLEGYLEVAPPEAKPFSYLIESATVRIGRDLRNELAVNDALLSKLHAKLAIRGDKVVVMDGGGRNGTFLNGKRIVDGKEYPLAHGDEVSVGLTKMFMRYGPRSNDAPPLRRIVDSTEEFMSVSDLLGDSTPVSIPKPISRLLLRLCSEVLSEPSVELLWQATCRLCSDRFEAQKVAIISADGKTVHAVWPNDAKIEIPQHFIEAVVERRGVVLIRDVAHDAQGYVASKEHFSVLAVPVWNRGAVEGLMVLESKVRPAEFDENHAAMVAIVASLVGVTLDGARARANLQRDNQRLMAERRRGHDAMLDAHMLGDSLAVRMMREQISSLAPQQRSIHVVGLPCAGTEAVARALHSQSEVAGGPFVTLQAGIVPESLLEEEVFGKGDRALFALAKTGTLFIDQVDQLPLTLQAKLAESIAKQAAGPRVLASSAESASALASSGKLNKELAVALGALTLSVPRLEQRRDDLGVIANEMLRQLSQRHGKRCTLSAAALNKLEQMAYPNDFDDLRRTLERAVLLVEDGGAIDDGLIGTSVTLGEAQSTNLEEAVAAFERDVILRVLQQQRGNRTRTAAVLGLTRQGFTKKLARLGIGNAESDPD